jgi:predicted dehydrogenase
MPHVNRRQFVSRSGLAALGAAAMNLGAKEREPRIRCAILGIDHSHAVDVLQVLRKAPDYQLAGVCEPNDGIRQAVGGQPDWADVNWLTLDALMADPSIEMVAVESGVPRLLALGRQVIDAGKHLHLDKPAGASLPEFRELLEIADRGKLIVQMGYMFRYNPGFDLVRNAVKDGWLGPIYSIHASMATGISPEKRTRIAYFRGGMMLELGCHLIDMIVLLMGVPKKITPFLRHDSSIVDGLMDNCVTVFEYDGAMATVSTAAMETDAFPTRRFVICGQKGKIIIEPLEPPVARLWLTEPRGSFKAGMTQIELPDLDRHVADFAELAQCIRGQIGFPYSSNHDFETQRTILLASGHDTGNA